MGHYEERRANDPKGIVALVIVVAIMGFLLMSSFAHWLGVDLNAAFSLVIGIVCAFALLGIGLWSQTSDHWPITVANALPLALFTAVLGVGPALTQMGCIGPLGMCFEMRWWGNSYLHYAVAFGILIFGYGYLYLTRDA